MSNVTTTLPSGPNGKSFTWSFACFPGGAFPYALQGENRLAMAGGMWIPSANDQVAAFG